jgi:hypothetical protein
MIFDSIRCVKLKIWKSTFLKDVTIVNPERNSWSLSTQSLEISRKCNGEDLAQPDNFSKEQYPINHRGKMF